MTFYFVLCFTEKNYLSKPRLLYIKKRMTESLNRHVVYIICTFYRKKPITLPGGTNSLEHSIETLKQSLDPRINNQYSHTCL